jgi:flavin-dependent dehydrogenase
MDYVEPNRILIVDHAPGVWIWCIPFSDGTTSCGFVGRPAFFDDLVGTPEQQLRTLIARDPNIAARFEGCEMIWEPRSIQAWSATCDRFYGEGFVLTGNVTEFLDPMFSSGVTLATVSAQTAAHLVIRQLQGEAVDWQREYQERCMVGVETFRTFVMAWYDGSLQRLFFSDQRDPLIVSQICSVLAGYVWDDNNPFVRDSRNNLYRLIRMVDSLDKIEA